MMPKRFVVALCLTLAAGFAPHAPRRPLARTPVQLQAERTSLGGMMFGDLIDGAKSLARGMGVDVPEEAAPAPVRKEGEGDNAAVERMVQGVDAVEKGVSLSDSYKDMGPLQKQLMKYQAGNMFANQWGMSDIERSTAITV